MKISIVIDDTFSEFKLDEELIALMTAECDGSSGCLSEHLSKLIAPYIESCLLLKKEGRPEEDNN